MTGRFCLALLLASSAWLTVAGEGFFLGHFQAEVEEALVRLRGILEEERCRREFRGSRCQVDPYRMGASPQPP
eukprot:g527.t1